MSMSMGQNDTAHHEIDGEKTSNQVNGAEDLSNSLADVDVEAGQGQGSTGQETSMNNLPPELLPEILKCVDTRGLFKCRLVSRNWSSVSSKILTTRRDSQLNFETYDGVVQIKSVAVQDLKGKKCKLQDFVNCMKKSKNCPYSHFSIEIEPHYFHTVVWTEFLSSCSNKFDSSNQNQNQEHKIRIKFFKLHFGVYQPDPILMEKLRDLLVTKIPHLEGFGLDFSLLFKPGEFKSLNFFQPSQNTGLELEKETETTAVPVPVQLPYLKLLELPIWMFLECPGIVSDLLNAAVNLKKLLVKTQDFSSSQFSLLDVFPLLHSLGKLHLLQRAKIVICHEFYRGLSSTLRNLKNSTPKKTQQLDLSLEFKLRGLELYNVASGSRWFSKGFPVFLEFLFNLLNSSKDSLTELKMTELGELSGFQLPKFPNLTTLTLRQMADYGGVKMYPREPFFPINTRLEDIFPALHELCFYSSDLIHAFAKEQVPGLPSVKTLRLIDLMIRPDTFPTLTLMCPNLVKLQIHKNRVIEYFQPHVVTSALKNVECSPQLNLLETGRLIWTHMKKLETLKMDLDLDAPENNSSALDSCFTGISVENCKRLYELNKAEKIPQFQSPKEECKEEMDEERMVVREHPSILDMKDLRKLSVNLYAGPKLLDKKDYHKEKWTCVSQEYAFKLMPLLTINED